jgi:decaprenylphospho-beta-D-erythro-pentofuranosid-2-ulose 2-reductase
VRRPVILVAGGSSGIGLAIARLYAGSGWAVVLTGRSEAALRDAAADIRATVPHAAIETIVLDVRDLERLPALASTIDPLPDVVVCAVGAMGGDDPADPHAMRAVVETNLTGPAVLLGAFADQFRARGSGTLVGISSVAGDRGRAKTMGYGAAKAGFTACLSALRQRLEGTGVDVLTVRPGFVRTRMTTGLDLPPRLTASPDDVARHVRRAVERRKPVLVTPWVWIPIMAMVRMIPEPLFRRMRF